ncbi:hypothetical protein FKP32DRAFT_1563674, partial [Trametes sanguinea]
LLAGSNAARSDDTHSIKVAVIIWLAEDLREAGVSLLPNIKSSRGFNNPVTGRLLCPAVLDYDDDETRKSLENHEATLDGEPVNGGDWPMFVYDQNTYNPALPWESFLRGRLIIQAFRHIFQSPSSALRDTTTSSMPVEATRGTRTGVADLHGMTKVTAGSLIYAATPVHFALSSVSTFKKTDTTSDTHVFQASLVNFFDDPFFAAVHADLFAWWNR